MGITFYDYNEATEFAKQKEVEGFKTKTEKAVIGLRRRVGYIVSIIGKGDIPIDTELEEARAQANLGKSKRTILTPDKAFHVTTRDLGKQATLEPAQGESGFKGVSFAPSIKQAVKAIPDTLTTREEHKQFYVYTPAKRTSAYIYDEGMGDFEIIQERRTPEKTESRLIGIIDTWLDDNLEVQYKWIIKE